MTLSLAALGPAGPSASADTPLGPAFTYQGQLKVGDVPYTGSADLQFSLYDAPSNGVLVAGPMHEPAWPVTDGLFTLGVNFGSAAFSGQERWIEIAVRAPAGSGSYVTLSPRQRVSPAPHALFALNASVSGAQSNAVAFNNRANAYSGSSLSIDSGTLHVNSVNDRVGIGTTSPVAKLHVAGDVALNGSGFGLSFMGDTSNLVGRIARLDLPGSTGMAISDFATGPVTLHTSTILGAAAERVRVTPEGNVGIGTTTPTARLHVAGDVKLSGSGFGLSFQGDTSNLVGRIARLDLPGSSGMTISDFATGPVTLCTSTILGAAAERVRVTPDGKVGIGTTNPNATLDINGGLAVDNELGVELNAFGGVTKAWLSRPDVPGGAFGLADFGAGSIRLSTSTTPNNATVRLTVAPDGNIGIGTTSPQRPLQIGEQNTFGSTGMMRMASRTSTGGPEHRVWDIGVPQTGTDLSGAGYCFVIDDTEFGADPEFVVRYATGNVGIGTVNPGSFKLAVNGTAANSTGSWSVFSDARLKTNVRDLAPGSLERVLGLRGRTFEYTADAIDRNFAQDGVHTGFIAQEVDKVFPEWVDENADGYLYITERGTTALMVEALRELRVEKDFQIAEQAVRIDALETDAVALRKQNKDLEKRLAAMERTIDQLARQRP